MIEVLKKFFNFCGTVNKRKFYISIVFGVLMAFLEALRIPATYVVILALTTGSVTMATAYKSLGILLVSIVLTIIVKSKTSMLQTEGGYNTCANKRIEIAEHMRYLPMGYFNENSLGYITSVTTNTMESLAEVATKVVMMTTQGMLTTLLIICMMFTFDYRLALIVVAGMGIFLLANRYLQYRAISISGAKDEADRAMVSSVLEYVQGMSEIKSYSLYGNENKKLLKTINDASDINFKMEKSLLPTMALQTIITKAIGVCILAVSIYFYINNSLGLAECIMMMICAFMIYSALDSAGSFSALIRSVNIAVEKANAILNIEPMDIDGEDITPDSYDIDLKNVEFSYDKRKIIDNVSLHIKEGTTTAIVGPSGSGKTTLLSILAGILKPDAGEFYYKDRDLIKDKALRRSLVGLVPQTNPLMEELSAWDNLLLWYDKAVLLKALTDGVPAMLGVNEFLKIRVSRMSVGMKKRLSIACAVASSPRILLMDEPSAALDFVCKENIHNYISRFKESGGSVILVTHDESDIDLCNRHYILKGGRLNNYLYDGDIHKLTAMIRQ